MKKILLMSVLSSVLILQGFLAMPAMAQVTSGTVAYPYYPQPTSYCPQLSYNLYRGLSDYYTRGQVTELQQFLSNQGYYQPVTGYFGSLTGANVAQFQRQYAVYPVTGGVGPLTRAAIARVCNGGTVTTQGSLNVTPSSGQAPLAAYFNGSVTNSGSYIVDFGDGQTSGALQATCLSNQPYATYPGYVNPGYNCNVSATHTYTSQGTYTATLSPYIACMYTNPRCMIATQNLGQATVYVSGGQTQSGLTVTSPTVGQTYARGAQMPISWSGLIRQTFAYEPQASVVDLYTAAGTKIGTIAIQNGLSGSFTWSIPPFPNTMICTMQYPNALCGSNIAPGQYYIKVTAVVGSGFESNPSVIGTAQSGVFNIQ